MASSSTTNLLDEIVRRIVRTVHPLRIVLFGSAARDTMDSNSDLDLLVVMPDGTHRRQAATEIYKSLRGVGVPKDVIVVTESDVAKHQDNPSLILRPALEEGKDLYVAT